MKKKTVAEACKIIYTEVYDFWDMAKIPIRKDYHVKSQINKLYEEYRNLAKAKSRSNYGQKEKERIFLESLDELFDIGHQNALEMMKNTEDRNFYILQKEKGRKGYMAGIDKKWAEKEKNKEKRLLSQERLVEKERKKKKRCRQQTN